MNEPRAHRPMQIEYITVGGIFLLWGKEFYNKTQKEFVDECISLSKGTMHPDRCKALYKQFMDEAGLAPKFKCPIEYEGCTKFCGSYGCGG